mgnify:CR=1 FL=1
MISVLETLKTERMSKVIFQKTAAILKIYYFGDDSGFNYCLSVEDLN